MADVLTLKAHVENVREWPFDISIFVRLAVYLFLPLGSGAGAAIVERAINTVLGRSTLYSSCPRPRSRRKSLPVAVRGSFVTQKNFTGHL